MDGKGKGPDVGRWTWQWIFGLVVVVWFVAGFGTFFIAGWFETRTGIELNHTGTFGDTFGAVNSLFSALSAAAVAYALILQSREQRDARHEAEKNRSELEISRKHEADLAMLSALISAKSAEFQTHTERWTYAISNTKNVTSAHKVEEQQLKSYFELLYLVKRAEGSIGVEYPPLPDTSKVHEKAGGDDSSESGAGVR